VPLQLMVEPSSCVAEYATVSIAFEVRQRLDIARPHQMLPVDPPWVKDYDRIPGNHPTEWVSRFDVSKWCFAAAFRDGHRVGGAALVVEPCDVDVDTAQTGIALLWDLRVDRAHRRCGVGLALLAFVESHARSRGCRAIRVETQDINVAACRLYASAGYSIAEANRNAYPQLPDEVQLIWRRDLSH
jgi:ribosomal protein S18 acetylase RimI-like enzyme